MSCVSIVGAFVVISSSAVQQQVVCLGIVLLQGSGLLVEVSLPNVITLAPAHACASHSMLGSLGTDW